MPRRQFADVHQVYIDANVLVYLADETASPRLKTEAQRLLALFQRYRQPQRSRRLQLLTSAWAVAEAHGVLYEKAMVSSGVPRPIHGGRERNVRYTIPPGQAQLEKASQQLDRLLNELQATTQFLLLNDANPGATKVWQLVNNIARETAIYPTDSVHLALALQSGCATLIAHDTDFLDKIEHCLDSFIRPYRQQEFSHIPNLPPFQACGVVNLPCNIPGKPSRRDGAREMLSRLGFR